jgi:hypothetical protein
MMNFNEKLLVILVINYNERPLGFLKKKFEQKRKGDFFRQHGAIVRIPHPTLHA